MSPTIIASQYKGPSGTNDGTMLVVWTDCVGVRLSAERSAGATDSRPAQERLMDKTQTMENSYGGEM